MNDWEKEFDKKFSKRQALGFSGPYHKDEIKAFIRQLLSSQLRKELEKIRREIAESRTMDRDAQVSFYLDEKIQSIDKRLEK